jgi:hypothetical protein
MEGQKLRGLWKIIRTKWPKTNAFNSLGLSFPVPTGVDQRFSAGRLWSSQEICHPALINVGIYSKPVLFADILHVVLTKHIQK